MKLKTEKFGHTDLRVSELCLSTSNFSRYASQEESFAILDAFREADGNFIQTSGICPGVNLGDGFLGMPEEMLGRWLTLRRVERDRLVIATRFAFTRPVIGGLDAYAGLIRGCAEDSIRRIGCGHLDCLVVEWTDAIAPVAESIGAFETVIASAEVRHVILANFPPNRVTEAFAVAGGGTRTIAGLELDYSLATRLSFEGSVAKSSADYGVGVIARSPLAGGHLASRRLSSQLGALRQRGASDRHAAVAAEGVWPALAAIARRHHRTPAQVALSWVLAHSQVTSVLVSVSTVDQLRELMAATRLRLADEEIAWLGRSPLRRTCTASTA